MSAITLHIQIKTHIYHRVSPTCDERHSPTLQSALLLLKFKSSGATATTATATLSRNSYKKVAYATGGRPKTKVPRRKAGVGRLPISLVYPATEWSCYGIA